MICCLLALLAALPGVSLLRRMQAGRVPAAHCAALRSGGLRRDIGLSMAAAGIIVAILATALAIHRLNHAASLRAFGPICSALDRISPASWPDTRGVAFDR